MNYFEYFSEIEDRFTSRRGSLLLLSTLDWALVETWREAGVPLTAVLRGIDAAFDKYEARKARAKGRLTKVNGLAWCAQAVMEAAEEMAEASIGGRTEPQTERETGFERERVAGFLIGNASALEQQALGAGANSGTLLEALSITAARLRELAAEVSSGTLPGLEELDRTLTVLEDRLQAALLASLPEADLLAAREAAERELAPFRARLGAVAMRQVREQFVHKRLLQALKLPRLSLFYMPVEEGPAEPASGPETP